MRLGTVGDVESAHVPADRQHLLVGQLQPPAEKSHHGLLAVAHREVGIVDAVGLVLLPLAVFVLPELLDLLVDLRFADVVQKRRDHNRLDRHLRLYRRAHLDLDLPEDAHLVIDVQRMLEKPPGLAPMKARRCRRGEEAELLQSGQDLIDPPRPVAFSNSTNLSLSSILRSSYVVSSKYESVLTPTFLRAELSTHQHTHIIPRFALELLRKGRLEKKFRILQKGHGRTPPGYAAASLYGWHSLRATFVVLAVEAGVPLPDVQKIVGHTTAEMTMQYFNPTAKHTAERVREQMRGTVLDGRRNRGKAIDIQETAVLPDASAVAPVARQSVDALIAGLTDDQRKELARKLLGL